MRCPCMLWIGVCARQTSGAPGVRHRSHQFGDRNSGHTCSEGTVLHAASPVQACSLPVGQRQSSRERRSRTHKPLTNRSCLCEHITYMFTGPRMIDPWRPGVCAHVRIGRVITWSLLDRRAGQRSAPPHIPRRCMTLGIASFGRHRHAAGGHLRSSRITGAR